MKKKYWLLLSTVFAIMLVLAACGDDKESSTEKPAETDSGKTEEKTEDGGSTAEAPTLPMEVTNDGDVIDGGTLKFALVTDSPFQGILLAELYENGFDADLMEFMSNSIFDTDGDFLITDEGIAKLGVDADNNKVTVTIQQDVKWSDGEPLTADDIIYSYEIIGHPKYTGIRYDGDFENIIGAAEYKAGTADSISGIKKIDDKTVEISMTKVSPAIYSGGDGLWGYAAPKHQLKDIKMEDLISSDAVRKTPVTLGAFKIDKLVDGESIQYVANENYWRGTPKLDKVVLQVVPSASIGEALRTGQYDMLSSFPATQYDGVKDLQNVAVLARPELAYSYLGFKVGKYDQANSINVTDTDNTKMGDVKLRQAIGYAIDVEQVTERFYQGLRSRATSLIPPAFASFHDNSLTGFNYDPEKANALLDEAGYKDVDGDGIREDKDGNKFSINLASMSGSDTDEAIVEYYRQNWKEVGLDVQLTTGRLIEFNSFYDKVKADDAEIDMFMAAWGTGTNPSPLGLYGSTAAFNYSRFTTPELEKLLVDIDSKEAIDADYRANAFKAWEEYMFSQATTIPTYFRTEILPINKRIKNYNVSYDGGTKWHEIELTSENPVK
ncbi:oligopeptide ABC transporter substrate-binding protein [Lysinibacillus sp. 2017]|uniref:oligopeptide ABC transporter substrate-binding protein n=1 Tax=unclassified Lysinibacillus TaxID=2636778 RepID=UPI000D526DF0|nr:MULTISPECIES: oligopeptide ABC transporter substrate-binding protein [unclassified Lysinibacillus]AWE06615.1 oligopeptide ABC transporter substrate-binding protein [Lysinibacillus sp. 2017]TGN35348.1 oligopeptide ABC transporter substrate-binding protein [Lysinibacillus sp. S2017]